MPIERKTGPGYAYILCDVCGRKIRQKDAILITDRYNTQSNLLVCKDDADKTNPQNIPFSISELNITNPKLVRSEAPDTNIVNPYDNRVPSAPQLAIATIHPINSTIILQWQGPVDVGSGPIIGYKITRVPQLSFDVPIEANTNINSTYYEDLTGDISLDYSYTIAAINTFGMGPSTIAYYPVERLDTTLGSTDKYLLASQTSYVLTTGSGVYILAGNT